MQLAPPCAFHTQSSLALAAARTRPDPTFLRYWGIKSVGDGVPAGAPAHPAHGGMELAAAQPRVARALDQPRRGRRAQERRGHRGPGLRLPALGRLLPQPCRLRGPGAWPACRHGLPNFDMSCLKLSSVPPAPTSKLKGMVLQVISHLPSLLWTCTRCVCGSPAEQDVGSSVQRQCKHVQGEGEC